MAQTTITTDSEGLLAGEIRCRPPMATCRPTARNPPKAATSRSFWWCRKSSACMNTSRTSAAASPNSATRPSPPSCCAPGRPAPVQRDSGHHRQRGLQSAGQPGHERPRRLRGLGRANGGDSARLGITGFCWGGRITWLYAAHNPGVKAGVAWYGRLVGAASAMTPKHPVDLAGELNGPVLGLYGGLDQGIPLDTSTRCKPHWPPPTTPPARPRNPRLRQRPARLQRRLPGELSQGRSRRRLETHAGVVQAARGLMVPSLPRIAREASGGTR
jgi:hypothetical protein